MRRHEVWLDYAQEDLEAAIEIQNTRYRLALYLTQQCAEKAFKAFLIYNKRQVLKIHDLVKLMNQCIILNPKFSKLQKNCEVLNAYISLTRYPDNMEFVANKRMVKRAIKLSQKIYDFVDHAILHNQITIYNLKHKKNKKKS